MKALIFDCDGVLVDTERDGHRVAFNLAFKKTGLDIEWSVELYGELLKTGGGKERMKHYFDQFGWPASITDKDDFIKNLHSLKTDIFIEIIKSGSLPLRSGILRIIDEAISKNIAIAVCSTSNERSVNLIVDKLIGAERKSKFTGIFAGDMVERKKPNPAVYLLALSKLAIPAEECVVLEDSRIGLLAAKAAGMHCIITKSTFTGNEDFSEANKVLQELGDSPFVNISLKDLKKLTKG